jgi:hypothetical protein
MNQNAKNLDNKRLGKQRLESIQIASCLLIKETRWKNHPAVKMWKGNEHYLIHVYLCEILTEWIKRGFKNEKCEQHYFNLVEICKYQGIENCNKPKWVSADFIESHRSNLLRKDYNFYISKFPDTKLGLEYIWPV